MRTPSMPGHAPYRMLRRSELKEARRDPRAIQGQSSKFQPLTEEPRECVAARVWAGYAQGNWNPPKFVEVCSKQRLISTLCITNNSVRTDGVLFQNALGILFRRNRSIGFPSVHPNQPGKGATSLYSSKTTERTWGI